MNAQGTTYSLLKNSLFIAVLKGHGFIRAARCPNNERGFSR